MNDVIFKCENFECVFDIERVIEDSFGDESFEERIAFNY